MARKRRRVEPRQPRLKKVVRYRKGRRWVKPGTKGARRVTYEYRVLKSGKLGEGVVVRDHRRIFKRTIKGDVEKHGGLIWKALGARNVTTDARKAKHATITIRGRDHRNKVHRFKATIALDKVPANRRGDAIIAKVLGTLHHRGFRTEYPREVVPEKQRSPKSLRRAQLHDLDISVNLEW